jgi:hypothetical protein
MATKLLMAIHAIVTRDPAAPMEMTGEYDEQGDPVLRVRPVNIKPGTLFEIDEAEGAELIAEEAAREPTAAERRLWEESQ